MQTLVRDASEMKGNKKGEEAEKDFLIFLLWKIGNFSYNRKQGKEIGKKITIIESSNLKYLLFNQTVVA